MTERGLTEETHKRNIKKERNIGGQDDNFPALKKNIKVEFNYQKKTSLPKDIYLTDRMIKYAEKHGCYDLDYVKLQFERFCNHAGSNNWKKNDWTRAFYNWILKDKADIHPEKYSVREYYEI